MHLGTFVWGADTGEAWQFLVLCGGTPPHPLQVHPQVSVYESKPVFPLMETRCCLCICTDAFVCMSAPMGPNDNDKYK